MWPFSSRQPTEEKIKKWSDSGKIKPLVKTIERHADSEISIAAIRALAGMDSRCLDGRARSLLAEQFVSSDVNRRAPALEACAGNPHPETAERLFAAIEGASESLQKTAIGNLTGYFRKTRKQLVELSRKTGGEPPDTSAGRAASAVKEMWAAAGGDARASESLLMRSIRGDEAAGWAYWQSESLRRTKAVEAIAFAFIAHVEHAGTYDVLLKMLDDIFLGEPGDYQDRFQKLQRIVNTLREGRSELREQAPRAIIALLTGHSLNADRADQI